MVTDQCPLFAPSTPKSTNRHIFSAFMPPRSRGDPVGAWIQFGRHS